MDFEHLVCALGTLGVECRKNKQPTCARRKIQNRLQRPKHKDLKKKLPCGHKNYKSHASAPGNVILSSIMFVLQRRACKKVCECCGEIFHEWRREDLYIFFCPSTIVPVRSELNLVIWEWVTLGPEKG